jgi:hypothetical protein
MDKIFPQEKKPLTMSVHHIQNSMQIISSA